MTNYRNAKILKNEFGQKIICQHEGCYRAARHIHHKHYRSEGGSDNPENLVYLCSRCHVSLHSERGDFAKWGSQGGKKTAASKKSLANLRQFRNPAALQAYFEQSTDNQLGVQS